MDKILYELLNKGLDADRENAITDISLTWDNEITICTEGGKVYTLTIKESNEVFEE